MTPSFVRTVCPRDCYDTCTLIVEIENKKIISVKGDKTHPITRGFLCPRGTADGLRTYSEKRVLRPKIRVGKKPSEAFRDTSWSKVLDLVAKKLKETIKEYGKDSALHLDYAGNMGLISRSYFQRFWNALGVSSHDGSICSKSGHTGISYHYGLTYGVQPDVLPSMKLIVFWGFNAKVSAPHIWALVEKARQENEAIIISVDPRKSPTAESSDFWLNPKPGSDIALTYGLASIFNEKGWINKGFITNWCIGYDKYIEEAKKWSQNRVETITGLHWENIENLAKLYYNNKPSATMIGIGLQKCLQGADMVRAISLIPPQVGLHRGFYYSNGQGYYVDLEYISGNSLIHKNRNIVSQVALGEVLERGGIKFLWINSMNPAVTIPNQREVRKGLSKDDIFIVVHETHLTETTKYADIVLPAPTYLEKDDLLISYSHNYVTKSNKTIEPIGESRDEAWLLRELSKRLGCKDEWLYDNPWNVLEKAFSNSLEDDIFNNILNGQIVKLKSRPSDEYQTPSGKIEFYSTIAKDFGVTPIPKQQSVESKKGLFTLITSCIPHYTHSQFQEVYGSIEPIIWLNCEDAKEYGILNNTKVLLFNKYGKVIVKAIINDKLRRGVLWSPRLWKDFEGQPQNAIIQSNIQKIGGGPTFNSSKVRLKVI